MEPEVDEGAGVLEVGELVGLPSVTVTVVYSVVPSQDVELGPPPGAEVVGIDVTEDITDDMTEDALDAWLDATDPTEDITEDALWCQLLATDDSLECMLLWTEDTLEYMLL